MDLEQYLALSVISYQECAVRFGLAAAFGFFLGWDREHKGKTIDMQAYVVIAVTTCFIAIGAQEVVFDYKNYNDITNIDLSRVIEGVLTGLGFIGGGAIIKGSDQKVVGSATGASIWAAGSIGMMLGFGFYGISFMAFILVAFVMYFGKKIPM